MYGEEWTSPYTGARYVRVGSWAFYSSRAKRLWLWLRRKPQPAPGFLQ